MSRFSFMVWDSNRKEMHQQFCLDPEGGIPLDTYGCSFHHPENLILRQSTGLLDKNGKEIFEGDILSPPNCKSHLQWIDVEWCSGYNVVGFHFKGLSFAGSLDKCEVIGNIYENPLLPTERYT